MHRGGRPYIHFCDGLGALIVRPVYYGSVLWARDAGVEETVASDQLYGVWSKGHNFPLRTVST